MDMMEQSQRRNKQVLQNLLKQIQADPLQPKWIKCPLCRKDWNKLGERGLCVDCETNCNDC